jgi:mRNA-degrading endonuclease toxin of MazEF toxin-antitoxin module
MIRYAYLWRHQKLREQEEGTKDRPCLIVMAVRREGSTTMVTVAPITRRPPTFDKLAIEVPQPVKRRLGLDEKIRSWIVTNDLNVFAWPGSDLRPVEPGRFAYGLIPRAMFYAVRDAIVEQRKSGALHTSKRT